MNEIMLEEYVGRLGVSEEAKREMASNANAMKGMGSFNSVWFHDMVIRLHHTLGEIRQSQLANPIALQIDLNEPPPLSTMGSSEERLVGRMNEILLEEYGGRLGVSEEAKREMASKANAMKGMGSFNSVWFHDMVVRLLHTLEEIRQKQLENPNALQIDLNEPPPVDPMHP